jgi:hypothetical protein
VFLCVSFRTNELTTFSRFLNSQGFLGDATFSFSDVPSAPAPVENYAPMRLPSSPGVSPPTNYVHMPNMASGTNYQNLNSSAGSVPDSPAARSMAGEYGVLMASPPAQQQQQQQPRPPRSSDADEYGRRRSADEGWHGADDERRWWCNANAAEGGQMAALHRRCSHDRRSSLQAFRTTAKSRSPTTFTPSTPISARNRRKQPRPSTRTCQRKKIDRHRRRR